MFSGETSNTGSLRVASAAVVIYCNYTQNGDELTTKEMQTLDADSLIKKLENSLDDNLNCVRWLAKLFYYLHSLLLPKRLRWLFFTFLL
mgnify:CR=1 FL=1